jgi:hypothetical protein
LNAQALEELALTLDAAVHTTGRGADTTAAITCRENPYNLGNASVRASSARGGGSLWRRSGCVANANILNAGM